MTLTQSPIDNAPSYVIVARKIEQEILDGRFVPGDVLPSENALALQLGVNRSTLREAIRMLEQNGLVRREAGRKKLRVSAPRSSDISKRLTSAMIIQKVSFEDLYEAMYALEPVSAVGAAKRCEPELLEALDENLAQTRQALDDRQSITDLDVEFHKLIAAAAKNEAIILARQSLGDLFYPAFDAVMSRLNAGERLLHAHQSIVDAIRNHDPDTARNWMERHIMDFHRGYELANLDITQTIEPRPHH